MDQAKDAEPFAMPTHHLGQAAHCQTIDNHAGTIRQVAEYVREAGSGARIGLGERALELVHRHLPATPSEPVDHPCIVDIAAGALVQGTRHHDLERLLAHSRPS